MIRRGTIVSFDAGPPRVAVLFLDQAVATTITVAVAANILDADVTADRACAVALFDDTDVAGAVVIAVWDK